MSRSLTARTRKQYLMILTNFCNWKQQLPTEFIEEAEIEQNQNIKLKKRKIKKDLIRYIQYLKDENKSQNTIYNYISSIKAIYYDNDIIIPRNLPTTLSKDEILNQEIEKLPELDDVKKLVTVADHRNRAIILLQLSSGLSSSDIRVLKYRDFLQALQLPVTRKVNVESVIEELSNADDDEELIGWWHLKRYKTAVEFTTFNSPESTRAILDYLDWRMRENRPITDNDDWLFTTNRNEQLKLSTITLFYKRLNVKAGFKKRQNKRHLITSHQLREMFSNSLFRKKVDKIRVDSLLGRKINSQDTAYFRNSPEDLYKEYLKALPDLTLEKVEIKRVTSKEYEQLLRQNREMEERIENMEVLMREMAEQLTSGEK